MNRSDKERLARRQRMLARERGEGPGAVSGTSGDVGLRTPRHLRRDAPQPPPEPDGARVQAIDPRAHLKKDQRRRHAFWGVLLLAAAAAVWVLTGAFADSLVLLGDVTDTLTIYLNHNGSWPANTGITTPLQIEALGGGFVELDNRDVVVFSPTGGKIRAFQPGYARPTLAAGRSHFVVYNRAGTELRVESRTRTLYTRTTEDPLLLCAMSANGTLAVVTESSRYAAELTVYDPAFRELLCWQMTGSEGTPIAVRFASDNRRFAVGTLAARDGQLSSRIYLMDLRGDDQPVYNATTGSLLLRLQWLTADRLLAIFDNYLTVLNAADMTELVRYDITGGTLQSAAVQGRHIALLVQLRGGCTLMTMDETLTPLAEIPAGQATGLTAGASGVYLLSADRVQFFGYDGVQKWEQQYDTSPLAVLETDKTLVFAGAKAEVLEQ